MKVNLTELQVKILSAAAVILLVIMFIALFVNLAKISTLKASEQRLQDQLQVLTEQTIELDDQIEYYNTDYFIEQYAREQLNMKMDNEIILS